MKNIFRNKKIIITGHTGFKGSWLTLWLSILGGRILGISNGFISHPSHYKLLGLKKKIIDKNIDIRNLNTLKKIIKNYSPDFFFHLAGQSIVKKSYENPLDTWSTNTIGTINVLESLRQLKKKCVAVIITSDKCYENLEIKRGYHEQDKLGGKDPYSASKASADIAIRSYINSFFFHKNNKVFIATARAGNVIGGGDWSNFRLIPDFIKSIKNNKKFILRNPKSIRPWQHVFDCLFGYILLAYKLKKKRILFSGSWNFGPTHSGFPAKKIVNIFAKYLSFKNKIKVIQLKKNKYLETKNLHLNTTKVRSKLKYENSLNIFQSLKLTADWYDMYLKKRSSLEMINFSNNQILNFLQKIKY